VAEESSTFLQRRVRQHRLFARFSTCGQIHCCHVRLAAAYQAAHHAMHAPHDAKRLA